MQLGRKKLKIEQTLVNQLQKCTSGDGVICCFKLFL